MVARFRNFEVEALKSGGRAARQLIVAVTANGMDGEDSVHRGFDYVCPKPLNVDEIYRIVNETF